MSIMKKIPGISSPAKETMKIGQYIMDGLYKGISENGKASITAAEEMSRLVIGKFAETFQTYSPSKVMDILIYAVIFWIGFVLGFLVKGWLDARFRHYSGTILVSTNEAEEKTLYSLELDDYPERLKFEREVVFKIETSEESSDRT